MPSSENEQVRQIWQGLLTALAPPAGFPEFRAGFEELCARFPVPEDATVEPVDADGVPCLLVTAAGSSASSTVVWMHSGGYCFGSAHGYRSFAATLSHASGGQVLLVDYRLAPEHPWPAAFDDAKAAYRWLLGQGRHPRSIVVGGDSAGAGLAASTLLGLRDEGDPLPAGGVLVSPVADLTTSAESMTTRADRDPIASADMLSMLGGLYRGELPGDDPRVSAVFADLSGLPPLLVLVGSEEVVHDDAVRLVERARTAGTPAELLVGDGMFHIWPLFASMLPEGQEAADRIGTFVNDRTGAVTADG